MTNVGWMRPFSAVSSKSSLTTSQSSMPWCLRFNCAAFSRTLSNWKMVKPFASSKSCAYVIFRNGLA